MSSNLKYNDFMAFQAFDEAILREIIREGEAKLSAQLSVAAAADQRGLTILGFQVTALVAVSGGVIALASATKPDKPIIAIAAVLSLGLLIAICFAHASIFPKHFCFPGNSPKNWFASDWHTPHLTEKSAGIRQAMVEQCYCLYTGIRDNEKVMELNADSIKLSTTFMLSSTVLSFIFVAVLLIWRLVLKA